MAARERRRPELIKDCQQTAERTSGGYLASQEFHGIAEVPLLSGPRCSLNRVACPGPGAGGSGPRATPGPRLGKSGPLVTSRHAALSGIVSNSLLRVVLLPGLSFTRLWSRSLTCLPIAPASAQTIWKLYLPSLQGIIKTLSPQFYPTRGYSGPYLHPSVD